MRYTELGKTGMKISQLSFGASSLGSVFHETRLNESIEAVSFETKYFVQKELDIRGSRNAMPQDFRAVIHYLERGTCPVDSLITRVIRPEEALDTMRWWSENPGKVFRILVAF